MADYTFIDNFKKCSHATYNVYH